MAVIDIAIQPEGRTRVWFDCRDTKPRPGDEERIQRAVTRSPTSPSRIGHSRTDHVQRSGRVGSQHQPARHLAIAQAHQCIVGLALRHHRHRQCG
jgi:hypothetical protein